MRGSSQRRLFAGLCLLLFWQSGCAAFRPVHGVPARYLPSEMKLGDRSNRRTIDLSLLRQPQPSAHRIDSGDVLGVYVEGFVGKHTDPPPVFFPTNNDSPPSFGLPFPVREDGTISLPSVGSIDLRGLTLAQAEERVTQAYLKPRQLIKPEFHRVQVNLQRPRQFRVLVIRQDSRSEPQSNASIGQLNIGMAKRGTGKVVHLPIYNNDVLNALTATDGLPGLDAESAVYVIRHRGDSRAAAGTIDPHWPTDLDPSLLLRQGAQAEIPLIRGQSMDDDRRYPQSPRVTQAMYQGVADRRVQQVAAPSGSNDPAYYHGVPGGTDASIQVAPPTIWPDRSGLIPAAFDQNMGQNPYVPTNRVPVSSGPALNSGPTPLRSNGPGWNGAYSQAEPGPAYPPTDRGYSPPYQMPDPSGQPSPGWQQPLGPAPGSPGMSPQPMSPHGTGPSPWNESQSVHPSTEPLNGFAQQPPVDNSFELGGGHGVGVQGALNGRHVIRIPIRLGPGETADIRPEDVVLYDGDIVFIESRDTEVFYTAGLLGGGQFTLPRDYDLDILQALSLAQSRGNTGGNRTIGGVSALNNDVSISPSTAIVLRKLPDGGEIPVKIDLYRARTDLSERLIIQPGDYILLQYTPLEAVAAFFERHLLETALFSMASQGFGRGTGN